MRRELGPSYLCRRKGAKCVRRDWYCSAWLRGKRRGTRREQWTMCATGTGAERAKEAHRGRAGVHGRGCVRRVACAEVVSNIARSAPPTWGASIVRRLIRIPPCERRTIRSLQDTNGKLYMSLFFLILQYSTVLSSPVNNFVKILPTLA